MASRDSSNKKNGALLTEDKAVRSFDLVIDYPQNGEAVMPGHYAIRVSGAPGAGVEVCINGGEWQPCRAGAGYYWSDWWVEPGEFRLIARCKTGDDWNKSKERRVVVSKPETN